MYSIPHNKYNIILTRIGIQMQLHSVYYCIFYNCCDKIFQRFAQVVEVLNKMNVQEQKNYFKKCELCSVELCNYYLNMISSLKKFIESLGKIGTPMLIMGTLMHHFKLMTGYYLNQLEQHNFYKRLAVDPLPKKYYITKKNNETCLIKVHAYLPDVDEPSAKRRRLN